MNQKKKKKAVLPADSSVCLYLIKCSVYSKYIWINCADFSIRRCTAAGFLTSLGESQFLSSDSSAGEKTLRFDKFALISNSEFLVIVKDTLLVIYIILIPSVETALRTRQGQFSSFKSSSSNSQR